MTEAIEPLRERLIRVAREGSFRYADVVDRILAELSSELGGIGKQIRTQDNAYTSDAIFIVERQELDLGFDPDYSDGSLCWVHSEGEVVFADKDPDRYKRFEDGVFGEDDGDGADWTQTGFRWRWEYVQPFLTRAAAEEYCNTRGHNHPHGLRVYVDSGHGNPEWKTLRRVIGALP